MLYVAINQTATVSLCYVKFSTYTVNYEPVFDAVPLQYIRIRKNISRSKLKWIWINLTVQVLRCPTILRLIHPTLIMYGRIQRIQGLRDVLRPMARILSPSLQFD